MRRAAQIANKVRPSARNAAATGANSEAARLLARYVPPPIVDAEEEEEADDEMQV